MREDDEQRVETALKTWLSDARDHDVRAEQHVQIGHGAAVSDSRGAEHAGRVPNVDERGASSAPSATPNRMSRPTSGSRHCRAIRRDHDTSVDGQKRRT